RGDYVLPSARSAAQKRESGGLSTLNSQLSTFSSVSRVHREQNILQHLHRRLRGIDILHQIRPVKLEDRLRFLIVSGETAPDGFFVRIVEPVFLERALFETRDEGIAIRAG